jgi:F1F0 ATPase subunit 2
MTMTDPAAFALTAVGGAVLGMIFYEGLYRTIGWGMDSNVPARWFAGSLLLRTAVVLGGFCLISGGASLRLIACLPGFLFARVVVMRYRSAGLSTPLMAARAP